MFPRRKHLQITTMMVQLSWNLLLPYLFVVTNLAISTTFSETRYSIKLNLYEKRFIEFIKTSFLER